MHELRESERDSRRRRTAGDGSGRQFLETLEDRKLLSGGMGSLAGSYWAGLARAGCGRPRCATFQEGRRGGFFGGGSLGLGGGMNNPSLLLTAPLLEGGSGQTAPPSPAVFSDSAVQQAFQTLQTDFKNDVPSGAKPTHASVGALEDDLRSDPQGNAFRHRGDNQDPG